MKPPGNFIIIHPAKGSLRGISCLLNSEVFTRDNQENICYFWQRLSKDRLSGKESFKKTATTLPIPPKAWNVGHLFFKPKNQKINNFNHLVISLSSKGRTQE